MTKYRKKGGKKGVKQKEEKEKQNVRLRNEKDIVGKRKNLLEKDKHI